MRQFTEWANAFDLVKVYGSGWLGEAGLAFGKNGPFLPNGAVFKRIVNAPDGSGELFGVDDLYAAYLLQRAADDLRFGRAATTPQRRQTRFLFYMVAMELLNDVMTRANLPTDGHHRSLGVISVLRQKCDAGETWVGSAVEVVDTYLTTGTDDNVFEEPAFKNSFNNDLNGYLKWEKLGKSQQDTPRLRSLIAVNNAVMGKKIGNQPCARDLIRERILAAPGDGN